MWLGLGLDFRGKCYGVCIYIYGLVNVLYMYVHLYMCTPYTSISPPGCKAIEHKGEVEKMSIK